MALKWYQVPFLVRILKRIMIFRLKISKFAREILNFIDFFGNGIEYHFLVIEYFEEER